TCMKTVCCTEYRNVTETCMKEVKREVCKQVSTMKTVQKKVPETVCEEYCVGGHLCLQHVPKYECSFDPCTCQNVQKQCGTRLALVRTPKETRTRQVTRCRSVCEQVPCTSTVRECVKECVPVTVCKKVPCGQVTKQVPVCTTRMVREVVCEKVPYTVCKTVPVTVKKQVTCNVARKVCGAYVDGEGKAHECEAPGRVFKEGAQICTEECKNVCRMVKEQQVVKVPVTVCKNVPEVCVKRVPYPICKMVPTTVEKCVPVRTCKMVPYTACVKVPYCVTEMVPTQVKKCIPITKEYEVSVKKPRWV